MRALKIIGKIIIYLVGYSVGFMCVVAMLGFAVVFAPLYLVRAKQKKAKKENDFWLNRFAWRASYLWD